MVPLRCDSYPILEQGAESPCAGAPVCLALFIISFIKAMFDLGFCFGADIFMLFCEGEEGDEYSVLTVVSCFSQHPCTSGCAFLENLTVIFLSLWKAERTWNIPVEGTGSPGSG